MLTNRVPEEVIRAEHVRTLYRHIPVAIAVHPLYALAVAVALWYQEAASLVSLSVWFGSIVIAGAMRALSVLAYRRSSDRDSHARRWAAIAATFSFFFGVLWASGIVAFANFAEPMSVVLLVIVPVGLTAGAAASMASVPRVYFAFSLVVIPTLVLVALTAGGTLGYVIATICLLFIVADGTICLRVHRVLDQSLRLRLENEALRREAELANSAKTRFLASASHDLRQPLHALGLFFSTLSEAVRGPETQPLIERIEESIAILGEMLNALLDVSKLDAGIVRPKRGPIRIGELFDRLQTAFSVDAQEQQVQLRFRPCHATVRSDPAMLERILRNLIDNTLRYAKGSRVLVAARRRGDYLRLEVYDTGPGILEELQQEVFLEFRQLDNPHRDRRQGLGLGLAIVRRLAELLEHPLELQSRVGHGSRFAVLVPLCQSDTPIPSAREPYCVDLECESRGLGVLVLDDDQLVQQAMGGLLSSWGYRVELASTLDEATAKEEPTDLLIVDFRLAGDVTGIDAIEILEAQRGASIPALVITGDTAIDRLREATSRGYPLLHKPVDPAKLRSAMRYLSKQAKAVGMEMDRA